MTTCFFRYLLSSFYCVAHRSKCHVKGKGFGVGERVRCRVLISALADICLRRRWYIEKICQGDGQTSTLGSHGWSSEILKNTAYAYELFLMGVHRLRTMGRMRSSLWDLVCRRKWPRQLAREIHPPQLWLPWIVNPVFINQAKSYKWLLNWLYCIL